MLNLLASEAPNGKFLAGDINEVIWGSVAFLVLLALMVKFAGAPVTKAFKGRTARIEAELAAARAEREEAEVALTAKSADLPDISAEEERIRAEATDAAARLKEDMITRAQAEADEIRARGTAEVENYRRQAIADLTTEMASLTKDSAEDLVVGSLDSAAHGDLIDNYISQMEQL